MSSSPIEQKRIETYAQVLLEASRAAGHEAADLEILKAAACMPQELIDLFEVMSEHNDLAHLDKVAERYEELVRQHGDVATVTVTVAVPLSDELRDKITKKLQDQVGKDIYLIEKVDPKIMGGFIFQIGDERRDVSVRTQLEAARAVMSDALTAGGDA